MRPPATPIPRDIGRLALVRLDRVGDFLLWVSTARHYREIFPNARITLIGNRIVADLARALPWWDRFVPVRVSAANTPARFGRHTLLAPFDVMINTQISRIASHDSLSHRLPACRKFAADLPGPNVTTEELRRSNRFYSDLVALDPAPKHELLRNFELLSAVTGIEVPPHLEPVDRFIAAAGLDLPGRYAAIFPGSSWRKKNYPWRRIAQLCGFLQSRHRLCPVLCGGGEDVELSRLIRGEAPAGTLDLTGRLTLTQSLDVIRRAAVVVTNDSMAAHAANLMRRPSVSILSGGYNSAITNEGRFLPYPAQLLETPGLQSVVQHRMACYGCSLHCRYDEAGMDCVPCVERIPFEALTDAVDRALAAA